MKQIFFIDEFQIMYLDLSPCRKRSLELPPPRPPHLGCVRLSEVQLPKKPGKHRLSQVIKVNIPMINHVNSMQSLM